MQQLRIDRLCGSYDIIKIGEKSIYFANYDQDQPGKEIPLPDGMLRPRKIDVKKFLNNCHSSIEMSLVDVSKMTDLIIEMSTL